ncbi:hypothetical protein M0R04_08550 [Candidatus Dojkabacteria bacterium]|jgi:hypothetical protein|nr:hypothetical protein [Candidatus Dojkabacteria bacterium]
MIEQITDKLPTYPEMERIIKIYPNPQILLGEEICWTEKRDGSQLRIALVDSEVKISTRHQDEASEQFVKYFYQTKYANNIIELLKDSKGLCENPVANFNTGAVLFGELLSKGKSPARFETHEDYSFVLFDIWSKSESRFLSYNGAYAMAYHYEVPFVDCWALSRHTTLESLFSYRDEMLNLASGKGREGVVLKCYAKQIFAKEKLDTPKIERVKIEEGNPQLPVLADSEVFGAIAKAHADLGEDFNDKTKAMPLIAQYVGEEQKKHLSSRPSKSLFAYYQEYLEERKSE